jgi:hypothetical protein
MLCSKQYRTSIKLKGNKMSYRTLKSMVSIIAIPLFLVIASCEYRPVIRLKIDNKYPPTFFLEGDGTIAIFLVMEVPIEIGCEHPSCTPNKDIPIWLIEANPIAKNVSELQYINYGEVPKGYKQKFPINETAQPLMSGKLYYVLAFGMPQGDGLLFIRRGDEIVEVSPHNCPDDVQNK